jgi:AcrR family transcriptional regulator
MNISATGAGPPGRPRASIERDARELLLDSATELFATHGVAGTTLVMIAKRVGFTPAMVHYYFKNREQLLDAVVKERLLRIVSKVWDPVEPDADAAEAIRGIAERLLNQIEKMPWLPSLWIREILNEDGLLRERMLPHAPSYKAQSLARAIARGQADGSLNPELDPLLVISSTLGLVMLNMSATRIWAQLLHRKPLTPRAVLCHVTGLLLNGLRRARAGGTGPS